MRPEVDHNNVEPEKQPDCFVISCFCASGLFWKQNSAQVLNELNLTLLSILLFLPKSSSCELLMFRKTLQFYEFRHL